MAVGRHETRVAVLCACRRAIAAARARGRAIALVPILAGALLPLEPQTATFAAGSADPPVIAPPSIATSFGAATIPLHGTTSLSFTVTNPNGAPDARSHPRDGRAGGPGRSAALDGVLTGVGFADTLPDGLVVATPNGLTGSCGGGTIAAVGGSGGISLSEATMAPNTSCTIVVNVTGAAAAAKSNSVTVASTNGGSGNTASSSIRVIAPPSIAISFGAASIALGGSTALTFALSNPNGGCGRCASFPSSTLTDVGFADTLPDGLVVATPNGLTGSCGGGTITAVAGSGSVSLSGATLTRSCSFAVDVAGAAAGIQSNTTDAVTSANGGTGGTGTARVTVVGAPSLVSSDNPATEGFTPVTYSATVAPVPGSGTMGFFDDGVVIAGCSAVALDEAGVASCAAGVYPTVGTHAITATFSVGDGSVTSAPLSEVISDATLSGTRGPDLTGTESVAIPPAMLAWFVDDNPNGVASDFAANVDWGDGSAGAAVVTTGIQRSFRVLAGHTYAESGAHPIMVTITDTRGGATLRIGLTAEIGDIPLVVSGGKTFNATAGRPFSAVVATFVDQAGKEPVAEYDAMIDWGDGTSSAGAIADPPGIYSVSGRHTYAHAGSYRVTITVRENDSAASDAVSASDPVLVAPRSTPATAAAGRSQPVLPLGATVVLAFGWLARRRRMGRR